MSNNLASELLRWSMQNTVPVDDSKKYFDNKLVLVSGGFQQLLPVMEQQ